MKKKLQLVIPLGLLLVLTGCVAMSPERTKPTGITVATVPTANASVVKAEIYVEGDRLVVTGFLRRMHEVNLPGHVDISICTPEMLLERKSVKVSGLSSKKSGAMNLPFTASFGLIPPAGAKVTVKYHTPPFGDENDHKCL